MENRLVWNRCLGPCDRGSVNLKAAKRGHLFCRRCWEQLPRSTRHGMYKHPTGLQADAHVHLADAIAYLSRPKPPYCDRRIAAMDIHYGHIRLGTIVGTLNAPVPITGRVYLEYKMRDITLEEAAVYSQHGAHWVPA